MTRPTSRVPGTVGRSVTSRRASGLIRRSTRPAASSRSTVRIAVDGFTPNVAARAASLTGACSSSTTSVRNWGNVRAGSIPANARAEIAITTRDAAMIASTTSSASPDPPDNPIPQRPPLTRDHLSLPARRRPRPSTTPLYTVHAVPERRPTRTLTRTCSPTQPQQVTGGGRA